MRKLAIPLLAVLVTAFILAGAGCGQTKTKEQSQALKIGILPDEEALPNYVAEEKGYFKDAGLDVQFVLFSSAAERDAAVQAGTIDGAEGDMVAVTLLRQGGAPVKAAALALGATPQEGRFALLAAPGSSLTLANLKGKKLAVSKNTIIEFMADQMLQEKGVDPDSVSKTYVPKMPLRLQMLLQKQVDCAVLPDPLAALAEEKGAITLIDDTKLGSKNLSQSVFFFRDDAVKDKSAEIQKFLDNFMKAGQDVNRTPDQYRSLFIEKIQVPAEIQKTLPLPTFSPLQLPGKDNVQLVLEWMKDRGLLKQNFSYQDLVTEQFVK
jgi:NitT/TauT family transport system substrate-binding protein